MAKESGMAKPREENMQYLGVFLHSSLGCLNNPSQGEHN
jgi:hypothetical protein